MKTTSLPDLTTPPEASVVTVGNFDGVHRGHAALISEVVRKARESSRTSIVVTFDPHTRTVVSPGEPLPILTTLQEKALIIERLGVDLLVWIPFDATFARIDARQFAREILAGRLGAQEWVMGEGHGFGHDRSGNDNLLRTALGEKHFSVSVSRLVLGAGTPVSSTEVRARVVGGKLAEAVDLLGHPYAIVARRETGEGKGRQLGFPTLNFAHPLPPKVVPPSGVYAARLQVGREEALGALYFGDCPTTGKRPTHFEFFAFKMPDREPPVGENACLWVYDRVRPDKQFASFGELTDQIAHDVSYIKRFFQGV
jgi:riboflavin kinase/FMN adenylyltransferase